MGGFNIRGWDSLSCFTAVSGCCLQDSTVAILKGAPDLRKRPQLTMNSRNMHTAMAGDKTSCVTSCNLNLGKYINTR